MLVPSRSSTLPIAASRRRPSSESFSSVDGCVVAARGLWSISRSASKSVTRISLRAQAIAATTPTGPAPTMPTRAVIGPGGNLVRAGVPARRRQCLDRRPLRVLRRKQQIHRRDDEEREKRPDRDTGRDHQPHVEAAHRARAARDEKRNDAEHHRAGGHQDRAEPDSGRLLDRLALGYALPLQVVGELDDQDPVLADEPDQRYEPHFGIDIEAHSADAESAKEVYEDERPADR